jgi:hypothetical protein
LSNDPPERSHKTRGSSPSSHSQVRRSEIWDAIGPGVEYGRMEEASTPATTCQALKRAVMSAPITVPCI